MRIGPPFFIAARSLLGRRKGRAGRAGRESTRSGPSGGMAGAILGIGISLIPLVLVLVVSDGMIEGITSRYMETKTYHLQIAAPDFMARQDAQKGIDALRKTKGVSSTWFEKDGSGVAVSSRSSNAIFMRSIEPAFFADPGTAKYLRLVAGRLIPEGRREIVLGTALAQALKVKPGDTITVITPSQAAAKEAGSGQAADLSSFSPRLSFFKIVGTVSAGYRDLDGLWAFISPEAGESLLAYPSASAFFGVKTAAPFSNSLGKVKNDAVAALAPLYPEWFDPYLARAWPEIERSLYRSFGTTKSMLLFIMGIALLVAAINLGSSLSTFVVERSMDIAVLRSVGATDAAIRRIFAGAGLITGALGTSLGVGVGLLLAWNVNGLIAALEWLINVADAGIALVRGQPSIPLRLLDPGYYLERIPVVIDAGQIALVAALSVALSAAASLVPAYKASRISVQELIRKS
ncbi:FtsX-like permease family protein [bacterium]|nr:FtsX-like permease family protein [bacterium]